jgi:hypothetical protein
VFSDTSVPSDFDFDFLCSPCLCASVVNIAFGRSHPARSLW